MYVNKTLALTLCQDILSINRLLGEISNTHQLNPTNSWLFPTKPYSVLSETISNQALDEYSYEKCLEIIVDRLYVFINFILQHLNKKNQFSKTTLVAEPTKTSIGLLIRLVWDCITKLCNEKLQSKKLSTRLVTEGLMDQASQTDIIALNRCDSCSSAISCMKSLLSTFQKQKEHNNVKYQMLNITQFGSMLKATSSIEEALKNLNLRLHNESREKEKLKIENDQFISKIKQYECKSDFLEEEIRVLRKELDKGVQEIISLKDENCRLSELGALKNKNIIYLEKTLDNFSIAFQSITKDNVILKSQNKILQSDVDISISLLQQYHNSLKTKLLNIDDECNIIKAILEQYENSVLQINTRLVKIVKNIGKIQLKVTHKLDTKDEALQDFQKYENFCIQIKEVFKEKMENSKPTAIVSIKGNPVEDITRQIEDNEGKISNLKKENSRLEILLDRFKSIQKK